MKQTVTTKKLGTVTIKPNESTYMKNFNGFNVHVTPLRKDSEKYMWHVMVLTPEEAIEYVIKEKLGGRIIDEA